MSVETDILKALQTAVAAAVDASALPLLPIKYLGRTFIVPDDQKWLEIVNLPNDIQGAFWGNEKYYRGTMRLILHWQNDDAGVYVPTDLIAQVGSFFDKDKSLRSGQSVVKIYEKPGVSALIEAGTETLFVLSVRYQSFSAE
jgi:hypothetical protein